MKKMVVVVGVVEERIMFEALSAFWRTLLGSKKNTIRVVRLLFSFKQ